VANDEDDGRRGDETALRNVAGMLVLALTVVWFGGSAWATNLPDT